MTMISDADLKRLTNDRLQEIVVRYGGDPQGDMGAMARELLALRTSPPPSGEAGKVKVKPLVWEREESDWWVAQPPGMIGGGGYEVRLTSAGRVRARCGTEDWYYFDGTADQAKAAFQSDYETRIRSALLPTIKEPTDGK